MSFSRILLSVLMRRISPPSGPRHGRRPRGRHGDAAHPAPDGDHRPAHPVEHRVCAARPARDRVLAQGARVLELPDAAVVVHALPPRSERLDDARNPRGCQRRRAREGVRRLRRSRRHRPRLRDVPRHHDRAVPRRREGRRARRRGQRALHVGRDARQADVDRRADARRCDHRGRGPAKARRPQPPVDAVRKHGRRDEVREGRHDRRARHHRDQRRRRRHHRDGALRHPGGGCARDLRDADRRRRIGRADLCADHRDGRGRDDHARRAGG